MKTTEELYADLDNFDAKVRADALETLSANEELKASLPASGPIVNMHSHTFFSYNAYGYSPSHVAWMAKEKGFSVAATVDFDVLDSLDEFTAAGRKLNLKTAVGVESRVFVPEFADASINSPGEPGISYNMGIGFINASPGGWAGKYLKEMRETAAHRNRELVTRANAFLSPVELDYDADVLPLTPSGNVTERHICLAYARKGAEVFKDEQELALFWSEKLETPAESLELPTGAALQTVIRAKTMKQGGAAYVKPGKESFPLMADMNRFSIEAGAIPCLTWLDGTSEAEQDVDKLYDVNIAAGAAAINIIPDRNFTAGVADQKLSNLQAVIEKARECDFPVVVGTEMNSPGNKLVDDFASAELEPYRADFLKGAHIVYAHSALRRALDVGYLGPWADEKFSTVADKNEFFDALGQALSPATESKLSSLSQNSTPTEMIKQVE